MRSAQSVMAGDARVETPFIRKNRERETDRQTDRDWETERHLERGSDGERETDRVT